MSIFLAEVGPVGPWRSATEDAKPGGFTALRGFALTLYILDLSLGVMTKDTTGN